MSWQGFGDQVAGRAEVAERAVDEPRRSSNVRAVALGTLAQAIAKVVNLGLNVVATLAVIRHFGPARYGDYVFAIGLATVFGIVSDFGLDSIAAREMARDRAGEAAILGDAMAARTALAVAAGVLAQAALLLLGARWEIHAAVAVASCLYLTDAALSVNLVFQVRLAMHYAAAVAVLAQGLDTALVVWLTRHGGSLVMVVGAPVVANLAAVAVAWVAARRRFSASLGWDRSRIPHLLREALPAGIGLIIAIIYVRLDTVLLATLRTSREVGFYGAAFIPIQYVVVTVAVLAGVVFPLLSRSQREDGALFRLIYRRGTVLLLAAALPIPVVLAFIAGPMVVLAYGAAMAPSARPLQVLGPACVLMVFNAWQSFVLMSADRQAVTMRYNLAALGLNVVANVALIIPFGYMGAAVGALITSLFITACSLRATLRMGLGLDQGSLVRLAPGVVVLGLVSWAAMAVGVAWWGAVAIGLAGYALSLVRLGVVSPAELRLLGPRVSAPAGALP